MSNTISRVLYQMIIYLVLMLPLDSSDLPKSTTGRRNAFIRSCFGWGLQSPCCYQQGGGLLHRLSTLTISAQDMAVYFCCTFLGVASTGRYPASCPVKPGLSSPKPFRRIPPDCHNRQMEYLGAIICATHRTLF